MSVDRESVFRNLEAIRDGIAESARTSGRDASEVRLVAIGKTVPAETISWVVEAGVGDVGENYVKELAEKRQRLEGVTWHYVGSLQSHTAHLVADESDVVHTLAPGRGTERLSRRAEAAGERIPSLIQVDFTGSRNGATPEELPSLAEEVEELPGLELTGLMTLPPIPEEPEDTRPYFARLRDLRDGLIDTHPGLRELSMGMSLDFRAAVEEGATMVRVGTALFGARPHPM
ncbi:MAG: YggS family pyridoxal phosphate-dependent enzyme [Actinomycetota bacterium]